MFTQRTLVIKKFKIFLTLRRNNTITPKTRPAETEVERPDDDDDHDYESGDEEADINDWVMQFF